MSPSAPTPANPAASPRLRAGPWRGLMVATLVALAWHGLLVGWLPLGVGAGREGGVAPVVSVVSVRQIVRRAPTVATFAEAPAAPLPRPQRRGSAAPDAALPPAAAIEPTPNPIPELAALTIPEAPALPAEPPQATADAASAPAVAASPPPPSEAGGRAIPTYATQRPAAAVLQFELRRAGLVGSGELVWSPTEQGYTATFNGSAFGLPVLSWSSQGRFDADGLAPDRFVDQRRQRDVRAANFQRDKGRITFSGPPIEHPLPPGAQDRLSWMLQLPAIIAADPAAYRPGAKVSMFVAGARGDADVWTFVVEAVEAVDIIDGRVEGALRLLREPRKPYDTRVEVWLDPAREHLPAKLRLTRVASGEESFEFTLKR